MSHRPGIQRARRRGMTLLEVLVATALVAMVLAAGGGWILGVRRFAERSRAGDASAERWARCCRILDGDTLAAGGAGGWSVDADGRGMQVIRLIDRREGPAWARVVWRIGEAGGLSRRVDDEVPVDILASTAGAGVFERDDAGIVFDLAPSTAYPEGGSWRMPMHRRSGGSQ